MVLSLFGQYSTTIDTICYEGATMESKCFMYSKSVYVHAMFEEFLGMVPNPLITVWNNTKQWYLVSDCLAHF